MGKTISEQMALDIFNELRITDTPITSSPKDIGFNRNNFMLDIADVGLLGRKALDVAYFLAYQNPDKDQYEVDLSYFRWLMAYDSNNVGHLRTALRQTQKAAIVVNDIDVEDSSKDKWVSVPLMGPVGISGGKILFIVPAQIRRQLKDTGNYTYLSLRIKARFSSLHASLLYDRLSAVAYRGGTDWVEVSTVREWMQISTSKMAAEFKYMKRDCLEPALEQINSLSDIIASYETKAGPGTKKIAHLKFKVTKKAGALDNVAELQVGAKALYDILRNEFGLSLSNIDEISSNRESWTDEWIMQAIEYTRDRIGKGLVKTPNLFLMKALRDGLKISEAEKVVAEQAKERTRKMADNQKLAEKNVAEKEEVRKAEGEKVNQTILDALKAFDTLDMDKRRELVSLFSRSPSCKVARKRADIEDMQIDEHVIRGSEILAKAFGGFIAWKL